MPDSQPPPLWGPAYGERDLDALLSGDTASTPVALQPVVSTLAALRAAATGRELSDEAAARAAFRAFATVTVPPPAMAPPAAGAAWTAAAEHPAVTAHTLILAPPDDRRPSAGRRRHRHRRPAPDGGRKTGIAMTLGAAAALIVVAVAVTCVLGGVGSITSSFGRQPASASASARSARPSPGSQALLATGAASEPTASPKTTGSAPAAPRPTSDPRSMCRQYFEYVVHQTPGGPASERALHWQLGKLARSDSSFRIRGYCLRVLANSVAGSGPRPAGPYGGGHGGPGWQNPGTGSLGTPAAGQGGVPGVRVGGP
jgi:hypothetical protein